MKSLTAYSYVNAYVDGRLSGARYYREQLGQPDLRRPNNPLGAGYLNATEWDRGFSEGYSGEQARHRRSMLHAVTEKDTA